MTVNQFTMDTSQPIVKMSRANNGAWVRYCDYETMEDFLINIVQTRSTCGQCGQPWTSNPCGFSHLSVFVLIAERSKK